MTYKSITSEQVERLRQLEMDRHRQAVADLDATARVIESAGRVRVSFDSGQEEPTNPPVSGNGHQPARPTASNKRVLLKAIADAGPEGLTTRGVIQAATLAGLQNRNVGNVSPHLSGYRRNDGLLDREKGAWRITEAGRAYLASAQG